MLSLKKIREFALIYAVPVLLMIFHFALFIGASRYLVPAFPSICIFFALLIEKLARTRIVTAKSQTDLGNE